MKALSILKEVQKRLLKIEERLSQIRFDHKDKELADIDKKYEYLKQCG